MGAMTQAALEINGSAGAADIVRRAPAAGASEPEKAALLADAATCLAEHGACLIDGAIPNSVIAAALEHYRTTYDTLMRPGQASLVRNFQDDPLRAQIPIAPAGAIADPLLFANPNVMALVHQFLGEKVIIGEMGGVISHPGSKPQYIHRDSAFLFGGIPAELELPWWSFQIIIPLVDVPLECGPTEYWPGSHKRFDAAAVTAQPPQRTPMRAGSVFAYSALTLHRGGANISNIVRPIIYIIYQRPWYLERSGYSDKPQVRVTRAMLAQMAPEHRKLFEWALFLNRADSFDEFVMRWAARLKSRLGVPAAGRTRNGP
jgi:hypothetical protein